MTTTEVSVARKVPKLGDRFHGKEEWMLKRIANSPRGRVDLSRFTTPEHRASLSSLLKQGMVQTLKVRKGLNVEILRGRELLELGKGRAPDEFYEPSEQGLRLFIALHPKKAESIKARFKRRSN